MVQNVVNVCESVIFGLRNPIRAPAAPHPPGAFRRRCPFIHQQLIHQRRWQQLSRFRFSVSILALSHPLRSDILQHGLLLPMLLNCCANILHPAHPQNKHLQLEIRTAANPLVQQLPEPHTATAN